MNVEIEIVIKGKIFSGKTEILNRLGKILLFQGFDVTCLDDNSEIINPIGTTSHKVDSRKIVIRTKEVNNL